MPLSVCTGFFGAARREPSEKEVDKNESVKSSPPLLHLKFIKMITIKLVMVKLLKGGFLLLLAPQAS